MSDDMKARYEMIWRKVAEQLASGGTVIDVEPSDGRPIYTLVGRLGSPVADDLRSAAEEVAKACDGHYIYPAADIHMTVLHLSPYLGLDAHAASSLVEARVGAAEEAITRALHKSGPIRLPAEGLNLFAPTMFVQLFPDGNQVRMMRRAVSRALRRERFADDTLIEEFEKTFEWELVFANLIRFTKTVEPDFIDAVGDRRSASFGVAEIRELELVRTDKMLSQPNTTVFGRIDLE